MQANSNTDPRRSSYVFCDLSNIYVSLQYLYSHRGEALRINIRNLNDLLIGPGRFAAQAPVWVTSDGNGCRVDCLRPHTDPLGVKLVVREQSFGREIDVDQCLLDAIHATLNTQRPGVLVVATGDGAGYFQNTGFLRAVERASGTGWAVEVLAWGKTCHGRLRSFAAGGNGFTDLVNHYNSISFVEGGRRSTEISWRRRSLAAFPTAQRAA